MDRSSPLLRRLLWGVVLIVCTSLMLIQCMDRINRYVEEPVNVNVRITHNDTLEFPSITVCNKNAFNQTAGLQLLRHYGKLGARSNESEVKMEELVGINGLMAKEVWNLMTHDKEIFIAECWFGRGVKCDQNGNWTKVNTVTGPCYTYTLHDNQVQAVGTFHNLYLRLVDTTPVDPRFKETGIRVVLHEAADSPLLLTRTHSFTAELGWSREVKLELRKFQMLSTVKDPCVDDTSYSEVACHIDCFQKAMQAVTKCRMPFMAEEGSLRASNVSECSSTEEYTASMDQLQKLLFMGGWSTQLCECAHECHETTYQAYPENMAFKPNQARLRIFYEELVFEQISEEMAYPIIALLCDIGGTLGLLMGASVLTVCELLEVAWSYFLQRCCRLQEREPPQQSPPPREHQSLKRAISKVKKATAPVTAFASMKLKSGSLQTTKIGFNKSSSHTFAMP